MNIKNKVLFPSRSLLDEGSAYPMARAPPQNHHPQGLWCLWSCLFIAGLQGRRCPCYSQWKHDKPLAQPPLALPSRGQGTPLCSFQGKVYKSPGHGKRDDLPPLMSPLEGCRTGRSLCSPFSVSVSPPLSEASAGNYVLHYEADDPGDCEQLSPMLVPWQQQQISLMSVPWQQHQMCQPLQWSAAVLGSCLCWAERSCILCWQSVHRAELQPPSLSLITGLIAEGLVSAHSQGHSVHLPKDTAPGIPQRALLLWH